ncbi:hypothetical protein E8L99_02790 [Phreatobacter aquaticus]|uniref:DUF3617 family protein n=1 Tax=Phreatobacter aquaticus TaxID=2570229 RepID=A0A4D7QGK6_9HYPH|nr:hypothetical protein [Phreatobacter aquaticus]QCK84783.1 hypothetical protein E8L99_02790 [Phreatobacter aquaticus]
MPIRRLPLLALALLVVPVAAIAQEVPQRFRGTYAADDAPEACTVQESDGRIAVEADSIQFFASACALRRPRIDRDGRLTAQTACVEEGQDGSDEPRGRIVMTLRGERLGVTLDRDPVRFYRRCERALPVR